MNNVTGFDAKDSKAARVSGRTWSPKHILRAVISMRSKTWEVSHL